MSPPLFILRLSIEARLIGRDLHCPDSAERSRTAETALRSFDGASCDTWKPERLRSPTDQPWIQNITS
ncbi:hypothetical protein [Methylobacterium nodulans]|uniref:Uncharacterized protein n=1 Tax=Methylobacterium nodulans (strain LMG 21967 / CNCM I-2342 / ORS 2060) TaxID=460265 RepID=B8IBH0_METNO|nr:hypothetical protein [Methylobacterium nodulans]ACL57385.1 hypothetical protein Mnod_2414 [Methylobacterium nodulans ORS 2060]